MTGSQPTPKQTPANAGPFQDEVNDILDYAKRINKSTIIYIDPLTKKPASIPNKFSFPLNENPQTWTQTDLQRLATNEIGYTQFNTIMGLVNTTRLPADSPLVKENPDIVTFAKHAIEQLKPKNMTLDAFRKWVDDVAANTQSARDYLERQDSTQFLEMLLNPKRIPQQTPGNSKPVPVKPQKNNSVTFENKLLSPEAKLVANGVTTGDDHAQLPPLQRAVELMKATKTIG